MDGLLVSVWCILGGCGGEDAADHRGARTLTLHLPPPPLLQRYTFPWERRLKDDPALARRVYTRLLDCVVAHGTTTALFFGTKVFFPKNDT